MKIKLLKISLVLFALIAIFVSCSSDDDADVITVEPNDRTEQQASDKDSLTTYLSTHYYNSSFFATGSNHTKEDIIITELPTDADGNYEALPNPTENTLLIEAVQTLTTVYEDTDYEYYVLNLYEGNGAAPKFTDDVRIEYEGSLVTDATIFDEAGVPIDLDLTSTIVGWQRILPTFKTSDDFDENPDGTISFYNYGLGVMFIPSGMAYFSAAQTDIPVYSNLIFKFELLQTEENDHDADGVPSYLEDLDASLSVFDDDTDENLNPNFLDSDDDGDGVLTIDENVVKINYPTEQEALDHLLEGDEVFIRAEENSDIGGFDAVVRTIVDSNDNEIPDYLEATIDVDNNNTN